MFGRNSGSYNMNTRIDNILKLYNATERLIKPQELAVKKRTDCLYNTESVEKAKEHSLVADYALLSSVCICVEFYDWIFATPL